MGRTLAGFRGRAGLGLAALTRAALGLAALTLAACDAPARSLADPDPIRFAAEVYPVLLRDCAFAGCHGDPRRPLFVPGPGRTRLDPERALLDPPTDDELALAFDRARALLGRAVEVDGAILPLLLEKTRAGAGHQGRDAHGDNVYEDPEADGYAVLRAWVEGLE